MLCYFREGHGYMADMDSIWFQIRAFGIMLSVYMNIP
jgi:hypothetical protein